jgi:hypothetical protein
MARVKQLEERDPEEVALIARARKYAFLKSQLEFLEKEQKEIRAELFTDIELNGETDDKGNIILELPEEVEGYKTVMKQRRNSKSFNEAKAEEIIDSKGLQDKLYKTVRVVDEDAIMAALYNGELTEQEIDEMYPISVIWALVMKKN